MKYSSVLALLLALGATAQGKPVPVEPRPAAISPDDLTISTGAAGATLEQDYFRAPQQPFAAGGSLCRVQLRIFDTTRVAQSCN